MLAVGVDVGQVVQHIDARGAQADRDEGEDGAADRTEAGVGMGRDQGHEDQQVLGPLVRPRGPQQLAPERPVAGEHALGRAAGLSPPDQDAGGVDVDAGAGRGPDRRVGVAVAGVAEWGALRAGMDRGELVNALQIVASGGGDDGVEQAQVAPGDPARHGPVGRGGQGDAPPRRLLFVQVLQQALVVSEAVGRPPVVKGGEGLGPRLVLERQRQDPQGRERLPAHHAQQRFKERVRPAQRAVEIDVDVASRGGRWLGGRVHSATFPRSRSYRKRSTIMPQAHRRNMYAVRTPQREPRLAPAPHRRAQQTFG